MTVHLWQCHIWSPTQSAKCDAAMQHVTKCYMSSPTASKHASMFHAQIIFCFPCFGLTLQFYMTTVCWLYVHSLGFFNSYIDLNQYAQYKEMAHFSAASFVLKKSTMHRCIGLLVYPPEIGPLVRKDFQSLQTKLWIYLSMQKFGKLYWPNLLLVWGCVCSGSCGLDTGYRHLLAELGEHGTQRLIVAISMIYFHNILYPQQQYMCPGGQVVRTSFYTSLSPL